MKILYFANTEWYLYNFRLSLLKKVRDLGIDVILISPPGEYGARLEAEGFRWVPLPMDRRSLNPLAEIRLLVDIVRIYECEKPDLVHHFTIKSVIYGSIAAIVTGVRCRINAITGLGHVFISNTLRARLLRQVVRMLVRFAVNSKRGRLILQNNDDRELFLENKLIDSEYIRVIRGSGVNTKRFDLSNKLQENGASLRILLATRLLWEKGVREYVEAAKLLSNKKINALFLLAGSPDPGNPASVPQESILSWDKDKIIVALGHTDDMPSLLKTVDLVVLPSYREGTPRILLEAAASGLPIVTTDVPGCREIVSHHVNGLLVAARDSHQLAEAILYMVTNPAERIRMGKAGREKVMTEFDESIVISATLNVYDELISQTGDIKLPGLETNP